MVAMNATKIKAEQTRKVLRDTKSVVATILLLTWQNDFFCYHLPCSLEIFVNVSTFLYVKVNSKVICEALSISPFFFFFLLMSAIFVIQV